MTQKKTPYNFLYTPLELTYQHQEARRIADSGELSAVTRAYYNLETSLIPAVGRDQMRELIEMYRERGDQALATLSDECDRLTTLIEDHDALSAFNADTIEDAIAENQARDHDVSTFSYQRSAGGQNRFLEVMERFDYACCLVEILFLSNQMDPIQRHDCLSELRSTVTNLSRHVKRQHRKAITLSQKQKERQSQDDADDAHQPDKKTPDESNSHARGATTANGEDEPAEAVDSAAATADSSAGTSEQHSHARGAATANGEDEPAGAVDSAAATADSSAGTSEQHSHPIPQTPPHPEQAAGPRSNHNDEPAQDSVEVQPESEPPASERAYIDQLSF